MFKTSRKALTVAIGAALAAVIIAPIALSSQDLVKWASDPAGLGLTLFWAWFAFIALDLAAAVCVGMVTLSAVRGEGAGAFKVLTWAFAGISAYANHRYGQRTTALDDEYFFPAMSLLGPVLLEVTLYKVRKWARAARRTAMTAKAKFGARWIPGVAFRETVRAWAASRRENIAQPTRAIAHVREQAAIKGMTDIDALRYAFSALGADDDPYRARVWLQARGRTVTQDAADTVTGITPPAPTTITAVQITPAPAAIEPPRNLTPAQIETRAKLLDLRSNRDRVRAAFTAQGDLNVPTAVHWLAEHGITVNTGDAYAVRRQAQITS